MVDFDTIVHIKMRKDGDLGWIEKDLTEFEILQFVRILFKENRSKFLGYFVYDFYSKLFPPDDVKKNLTGIGISLEDIKKYEELEEDKRVLSTISKLDDGKKVHTH